MASITTTTFLLVSAAIARLAFAETTSATLLAFPNGDCNKLGYYQTIQATNDACPKTYLGDDNYATEPTDKSLYKTYLQLQTHQDEGCEMVIGRDSALAKAPPCGECIITIRTQNKCAQVDLPTPFYAWQCCGDECDNQCGQVPGKRRRTIEEAAEIIRALDEEDQAKKNGTSPDIANLKNRSPASLKPRKGNCKFNKTGGKFTQAGTPVKVSRSYGSCQEGCQQGYSGTVESSFSNTFGVSESSEAGFFEIVSETVSFDYSHTWEKSKSSTVSGMATFQPGQSGYITFAPYSQCIAGTFTGSDCAGMGIPEGGEAKDACVPEYLDSGIPDGDVGIVSSI